MKCPKCKSERISRVAIAELVQYVDGVAEDEVDEDGIEIGDMIEMDILHVVGFECRDCDFKSPRPSDFGLPGHDPQTPGWKCPKCGNIDAFEFHMEEGAGLLTFQTGQPTIISTDGSINGTDIKCLNCSHEGNTKEFSVE